MSTKVSLQFPCSDKRIELSSGVIDQEAIDTFLCGCCASLALALHELTGWPMFWLWRPGSKEHGHAVVKSPSGHYVDVFGPGALGRWKISCFGEEFSVVPRSADDFAYAKLNLEATLPFAEAVLNRYFGSSDNPDSEFEVEESVWGWE